MSKKKQREQKSKRVRDLAQQERVTRGNKAKSQRGKKNW